MTPEYSHFYRDRAVHDARLRRAMRRVALVPVWVLCALLTVVLPSGLKAQMPADTVHLSLADAVVRSLQSSPELERERAQVEIARAEILRAGGFFPSPLAIEYSRATDAPFEGKGEGGWELGVSQQIDLSGAYGLRRQAATVGVAQAKALSSAAERTIVAETRSAYWRMVSAEDRLALVDSLVALASRLDGVALQLLSVLEISELDRNAIRIELGRTELERLTALTALAEARAGLVRLLALGPNVVPVSVASAADLLNPTSLLDSVASIERSLIAGDDAVLRRRPEWEALDRAVERLQIQKRLATRSVIPGLTLGVSYGNETSVLSGLDIVGGNDVVREGFGTLRSQDQFLGVHLGLSLALPVPGLYDYGAGEAAVADAQLQAVESERRVLAAGIRAEVHSAAERLRNAAAAYKLYQRDIAPLILRNRELVERGYTGGELGATEVIAQQNQIMRIGEALIEARREYNDAIAAFERATGSLQYTR